MMRFKKRLFLFNLAIILGLTSLAQLLAHFTQVSSNLFALLMSLGAICAMVASAVYASRRSKPILEMVLALRRMADGDSRLPFVDIPATDEIGDMGHALNELLFTLQQLSKKAKEVAQGNLNVTITAKGDLAKSFRAMLVSQRKLVKQIADTAVQLNTAMTQFQISAEQQERGAIEQSSAVEEYQRTMETLLENARQIASTAQNVLQNAEKTQNNSRLVTERIAALTAHSQRISEILQMIKDIANKSDLLALNAALEGTKAGEAGRGFSLVANQMQRLAENVIASVRDIKELTDTIAEATRATVLATEESTKLAADTTRSTRQISMIIHQQREGTEQMSKAMEDVSHIARETAVGSKQIVASSRDLAQLSAKLQDLVGQFATTEGSSKENDTTVVAPE